MAGAPRPDSYNFKAYRVDSGRAVEMIVSINKDYISIDGIRKTWHLARQCFAANSTTAELGSAEARREDGAHD